MKKKAWILILALTIFSGCMGKSKIDINLKSGSNSKKSGTLNVNLTSVTIVNHQLVVNGTNLSGVTQVSLKEGSNSYNLQIESKSASTIIANTLNNVSLAAGKVFDLIISNGFAASTFQINFSLCDSTLNSKTFDCTITPNDKDVLSFDANLNKWIPRNVNGLTYKGTFSAVPGIDPGISPQAGDYFVINAAGTINSINYAIGDWIVYNADDLVWQKVSNSKDVLTVFGRTGNISAKEGDYNLNKLADVDLVTDAPLIGDALVYDGTNWVPSSSVISGTTSLNNGSVAGSMSFKAASAPSAAATEGKIYFDTATNKFKVSENNGSFVDLIVTNALGGTGAINSLPRFTATGTLGNSGLVDDGSTITSSRAILSTTNPIATGATINLSSSNTHTLASVGGSVITLTNMVDGGVYNIVIEDTTSRTYTFSGCTASYFKPVNGLTTVSTRTIYGLMTVKKGANWDCYVTWSTGFQP